MSVEKTRLLLLNTLTGFENTDVTAAGISRVIEGLDKDLDIQVSFLDLERLQLPYAEIERRVVEYNPRIIAFSACLTHAYRFVKTLSLGLRKALPQAVQVLGGQMAVVSNILLQKTGVDFCVVGESEPAFSNLLRLLLKNDLTADDKKLFTEILGLTFMLDGVPYFTGYENDALNPVRQTNYELISKYTDLDYYLQDVTGGFYSARMNRKDIRYFYGLFHPENLTKRIAKVYASKGCVNRCTFCHRSYPGYKALDPKEIISHIEHLMTRYNVGVIQFADENFGTHKQKTAELVEFLREKKLNWSASGKATTIDRETLRSWKDAGCVGVALGIESGSQQMLDVMEKRTTLEENLNALKLVNEQGVFFGTGLVLGMPGESEKTVEETIKSIGPVIPDDIAAPYEPCINWFQAIPGTPGYEFARSAGLIGDSLEEEEQYLESLYGINANNIKHYLNFTDHEKEEIAYWKEYIILELTILYIKKHGILPTLRTKTGKRYKVAAVGILVPRFIRKMAMKYLVMIREFGPLSPVLLAWEKISRKKKPRFSGIDRSLRKIMEELPQKVRPDDIHTHILRKGR
jgi:radical SAM superfamily enzyme YgiQ (UPF0313 family)